MARAAHEVRDVLLLALLDLRSAGERRATAEWVAGRVGLPLGECTRRLDGLAARGLACRVTEPGGGAVWYVRAAPPPARFPLRRLCLHTAVLGVGTLALALGLRSEVLAVQAAGAALGLLLCSACIDRELRRGLEPDPGDGGAPPSATDWEACEIVAVPGPARWTVVVPMAGVAWAVPLSEPSPPRFVVRRRAPGEAAAAAASSVTPPDPAAVGALHDRIAALLRAGWWPDGRGEAWFNYRFRRARSAR